MSKTKFARTPATSSNAPSPSHDLAPDRFRIVALLALTGLSAIFLRSLGNGFVNFDDNIYVTANPWVQQGLTLAALRWAFAGSAGANWHPMTWLSHMADCELFGLQPWGHHLVNVLIHYLNSVLLFLWLQRLTHARWRSFFVAAVFAVHPLHVESVAWISERKDVLSGFFFLLTLWAYAWYVERRSEVGGGRALWYVLALSAFAFGLMSKPMLVTVPFVLLLLDFWPLGRVRPDTEPKSAARPGWRGLTARNWGPLILEKIPFFLLALASSVITYVVQKSAGLMWTFSEVPFSARLGNALVSYMRYLGEFVLPHRLSVFYPHPGQWSAGLVLGSGLVLIVVTGAILRLWRRAPFLLVGWFWFLGMLTPVIGLVQVGWQSIADRYMYLPMIGLLIAGAWGLQAVTSRWKVQPIALLVAGAGLLGAGAAVSWTQVGYWKSSETLFRHALEVTAENFVAHLNLGMALAGEGRFEEAKGELREALRLRPKSAEVHNGLGEILLRQGRLDDAMEMFRQAGTLNPELAVAYNNLGIVLSRKGQVDQALVQFEQALKIRPGYINALNNLGLALQAGGRLDEAILRLQEATRLAPDDAEAHKNLGMALGRKGRLDEAVAQLTLALRLNPNDPQIHHNLGLALTRQGRLAEAITQFEEALALKPDSAETHAWIGIALARAKREPEAVAHLKQSLKLNPDNPQAAELLKSLTQ